MLAERVAALKYKAIQIQNAGESRSGLTNSWGSNTWPKVAVHYAPPRNVTQASGSDKHKIIYMAYEGIEGHKGKLESVFVFPLPPEISDAITTEWDNERSFLSKLAGGALEGGLKGVTDTIVKKGKGVLQKVSAGADRSRAAFEAEDFYFKGVSKREWSFSHKLTPTSIDESSDMKRLVDRLQYHASPSLTGLNMLKKPAEWEIHFMSGSTDNPFLPNLNKCILETVTINNTPNDSFQPSRNNFPNGITIEVAFKEMLIRTKDDITKNR